MRDLDNIAAKEGQHETRRAWRNAAAVLTNGQLRRLIASASSQSPDDTWEDLRSFIPNECDRPCIELQLLTAGGGDLIEAGAGVVSAVKGYYASMASAPAAVYGELKAAGIELPAESTQMALSMTYLEAYGVREAVHLAASIARLSAKNLAEIARRVEKSAGAARDFFSKLGQLLDDFTTAQLGSTAPGTPGAAVAGAGGARLPPP